MAHPFPTLAHQILRQAGWGYTSPARRAGVTVYRRLDDSQYYKLEEAWAIYEQEGPDTLEKQQARKQAELNRWLKSKGELPGSERFLSVSFGRASPDALAQEPGSGSSQDPERKS